MPRISRFEWFLQLRRRAKSFESGRAGWRLARYEPDELPGCSTPRHRYYATCASSATALSVLSRTLTRSPRRGRAKCRLALTEVRLESCSASANESRSRATLFGRYRLNRVGCPTKIAAIVYMLTNLIYYINLKYNSEEIFQISEQ